MHEPKQREFTFEHLLIGEISRHCWAAGRPLDVTVSRCDIYGYDVVLHAAGTTRFLQIKTRLTDSTAPVSAIYRTAKPISVPGPGAFILLDICRRHRNIAAIYARRLEPKRASHVTVGARARCASVADLMQLLFGFKPTPLAWPSFARPLLSAA